jgi:hypothetical protein
MIFCRYCGVAIPDDSVFCARCGKRLAARPHPRLEKVVQKLYLKTPYPYSIILFAIFVMWAVGARQSGADYSQIKLSTELNRKLELRQENLFQQSLSLIVENNGATAVSNIPIELSAKIEPVKPSEVVAGFLGRRLVILQQGKPLPLVVVLADPVEPGGKRRYFLEGAIYAEPPFKVTYEVREEGGENVLTSYEVGYQ